MVFGSYVFLLAFLPLVLLGWWLLRAPAWRITFLTLASYAFYAWWDWRFLPLLWFVTISDYVIQLRLAHLAPALGSENPGPRERAAVQPDVVVATTDAGAARTRRLLLALSLVIDLGLLGFFKYAGFFADSVNGLGDLLGLGRPLPVPDLLLPLGISFYIFTTIAATIDVYRGRAEPSPNLLHYACYLSLFPKLISGPITRLGQLKPQLCHLATRLTWQLAAGGLFLIACGLVKKLLIADQLAPQVNALFAAHADLGLLTGWAAAVGYTLQLYFDFSGYTDVAIGTALLLGLRLPQNFDSPYQSVSIQDFWRRWHITLSNWLRDYLYIPLGGNRKGRLRTYANFLITFLLGGLWHGAGWTFILWGGMHGTALATHRAFKEKGWTPSWNWFNRLITFLFVTAAWVMFRAPSVDVAGDVYGAMLGLNGFDSAAKLSTLVGVWFALALAALLVFVNVAPNTAHIEVRPTRRYAVATGVLLGAAFLAIAAPSQFLYFQF